MMLARVADSLYWIGRYVERAEHMCRLSDVMLTATLDRTEQASQIARIALAAVGDPDDARAANPYEAALSAYYARDMEGALAALTECVARVPGDPQARRFLASVLAFGPNGPPDGWTGVEDA